MTFRFQVNRLCRYDAPLVVSAVHRAVVSLPAAAVFLITFLFVSPAPAQETWRVLALRVSFPPESPDDETTSGTGEFDLRSTQEALPDYAFPFDTPPHDRTYFENHLQALATYYDDVSDGQLRIEYEVYPRDPTGSYELLTELKDFGNGRTSFEIAERIVRLFHNSVTTADVIEGGALDFSEFRSVIVFHAGLGGEASVTLNDVPSAFVSSGDLQEFFEGPIPVDDGSHFVNDGLLLPEAISSDGTGGLNGTLARFFGSQLGLPGLSNFEEDLPAVGDWSLMDTGGAGNLVSATRLGIGHLSADPADTFLVGFMPSRPLAWSRIRLGWLEPVVVTHDDTLSIVAPHVASSLPEAVRVPISADEYFLLENRMSRVSVEGRTPQITFSNGSTGGVWLEVDDIDAFIPGSGILAWHVDDAVIRATGDGESLNSNQQFRIAFGEYRPAIALEEADGFQDIGNISSNRVVSGGIISFANIEGGPEDPYYIGNRTLLGPDTIPNTDSNLRYRSGVTIEVLSPPGDTMRVAVRFDRQQDAWPATGLGRNGNQAPRVLDVDGDDGVKEVLRVHSAFGLQAWSLAGELVQAPGFGSTRTPAVGDLQVQDLGVDPGVLALEGGTETVWSTHGVLSIAFDFAAPLPVFSTTPVIARFPSDVPVDISGISTGNIGWGGVTFPQGFAELSQAPITQIAAGDVDGDGDNELIVTSASDEVFAVDGSSGSRTLTQFTSAIVGAPAIGDLDRDGDDEAVVVTADGVLTVMDAVGVVSQSAPVEGGATSGPVLGDLDGDGFVEALFGGIGALWGIRFNGVLNAGAPVRFPLKDGAGPIEAPPVLADLDADGSVDMIVGSRGGLVYGLRADGVPLPGFPVAAVGPIRASLLIDDLDADGTLEIVAFTDSGEIHLWHVEQIDPSLTGNRVIWGQLGGSGANTGRLQEDPAAFPPALSEILLPSDRVYCYPNPIRTGSARLRYYLGDAADVSVVVLNAVGEIVDRLDAGRPTPRTDNEIEWDTSDYASGLYIARLEATSGSRSEVRFIKAAVIR